MNENQKVVLTLFLLFVVVQLSGLFLGSKIIALPEIQPETSAAFGVGIFVYILVVTVVILLIIKYIKKFLMVMEAFALFFGTEIFFELLFMGMVSETVGFLGAVIMAAGVVAYRLLRRNIVSQNIALTLSIVGIGAYLGASLGILPAMILLVLLSAYDVIAVFKTKHMVTMAKEITKQKLAFTFAIPTRKHVFQLGGGDLVMPMIFTVSVLRELGWIGALITMVCSMLGLSLFFGHILRGPRRAWPALPPVTVGALFGFFLSVILAVGGLI